MIVLGGETATLTGSVAVLEENKLLAELTLNIKETHEARLLKTIDLVLERCGLTPAAIDLFAVSAGPGSFTGLRIGVATFKALAQATGKPLVGVSSLAGMAHHFRGAGGYFCPLLDARQREVFGALFAGNGSELNQLLPDQVAPPADFLGLVREKVGASAVTFWGSGVEGYASLVKECFPQAVLPPLIEPSGRMIAYLGWQKWRRDGVDELWQLQPNYLRVAVPGAGG